MAIKHHLIIFLTTYFICFISCQIVDVNIEPKRIKVGEDILITCTVTGDSIEKDLAVYLKCPSNSRDEFCIKNCNSLNICTESSCNRKTVGNQGFSCNLKETPRSLIYSYRFIALSKSFVNNLKQLLFTCSFRGKTASQQANVTETLPITNPHPVVDLPESTLSIFPRFSTKTHIIIETDNLSKRDIVLIALLAGLFLSFFINIWCCVQCCIKKSKNKHRRRNRVSKELHLDYTTQDLNSNLYSNVMSSQYNSHDNIKRTRSHPTLSNDDSNTPIKSNFTDTNHSYTDSINSKSKCSIPTTQVFGNYEINYGSHNSILNPMHGQIVLTPFQYIGSSMLPCLTAYPASYIQNMSVNVDKSRNNLVSVTEHECLKMQNSPIYQQLSQKPNEMIPDEESIFS